MKIEVSNEVTKEFQYMAELAKKYGSPCGLSTAEEMVAYVLRSVADGSRRPGSWERQMLVSMGLVVDCPEHEEYRNKYGA